MNPPPKPASLGTAVAKGAAWTVSFRMADRADRRREHADPCATARAGRLRPGGDGDDADCAGGRLHGGRVQQRHHPETRRHARSLRHCVYAQRAVRPDSRGAADRARASDGRVLQGTAARKRRVRAEPAACAGRSLQHGLRGFPQAPAVPQGLRAAGRPQAERVHRRGAARFHDAQLLGARARHDRRARRRPGALLLPASVPPAPQRRLRTKPVRLLRLADGQQRADVPEPARRSSGHRPAAELAVARAVHDRLRDGPPADVRTCDADQPGHFSRVFRSCRATGRAAERVPARARLSWPRLRYRPGSAWPASRTCSYRPCSVRSGSPPCR